jgi:hypothetical protein
MFNEPSCFVSNVTINLFSGGAIVATTLTAAKIGTSSHDDSRVTQHTSSAPEEGQAELEKSPADLEAVWSENTSSDGEGALVDEGGGGHAAYGSKLVSRTPESEKKTTGSVTNAADLSRIEQELLGTQ